MKIPLPTVNPIFTLAAWGLATFTGWKAAMWHLHSSPFPEYLPAMHTALLSSLPRIVLSALFGIVAMSFILFLFRMMMQALDSPFTSLSGEPGIYQPKRLNEDNNADLSVSVAAQDVLRRNDGQPFELTFTSGLPAAGTSTGPRLYITRDGSVHAGDILWSSGKQVVRTTNPAGGLHTVFDIPVSQVVGYASAGPRQL